MKEVLDIPRTAMEVYETLPEGTRCEVIDNTIYMSPSPSENHQDILLTIASELKAHLRQQNLGKVYIAPFDVYLNDDTSVVQPDILFIKREREHIITKRGIFGVPDLVVELLSSNRAYDQQIKSDLYSANGIPEYIIIDPESKEVWHYLLHGDQYVAQSSSPGKLHVNTINFDLEF